ncbi:MULTISPECIES: mechanosensitive ion channel family protein [Cellulophaga]|uniref:MscS Mechanosensitive ion channel n=2 Tax=Cellulophaga TaxID=104264 RepID=F0RA70_CELLC|nr:MULTISPECIES: mechanosensitive ion channel family protein [Cellulophaga]ADY29414.1 MscS Mechanosensitive ion channel [Cellulophaga lytica DSM 7489]AIM60426.1 mechanosensitive ion channel protein MscS [Cellulophaga lytica]EWH12510.1 mechanosensitive ion channel protein MscS [Cellulophaga geojensis KL-A]TVZ08045.1 small conductance mechanosensitive channel [Cellulophaga sp. RHA_52]WQG76412.1 mechanosensitive ion channel family protein [Cellulophaga lytica]
MNDKIQASFIDIYDKIEGWVTALIENLPNIIVAIIVMVVSYYAARFVNKWVVKLASKRIPQDSISNLIGRISATAVVLLGLFLALGAMDLSKTLNTLLAGAGISGLVIGLALQGTLSNLLSGVVLSFRKKIEIGNWIETNGYSGEVIDINLNSLVLKEFDNNLVVIPNKTIIENPFKNYSLTTRMRIVVSCGVGYESDLELVKKLTKEAIGELYKDDDDSEIEFYYTEFGDSSINFICRFWVDAQNAKNKLDAKSVAIRAIKTKFNANDINIPFPIRTLEFNNKLNINSPQK